VVIPPGHIMLFNQNLLHEVLPTAGTHILKRVFTGARLSESADSLIIGLKELYKSGSIIPLKSGQLPAMWPQLWAVNWKDKLRVFTEQFQGLPNSHLNANNQLERWARPFLPLEPYSEEELDKYYMPRRLPPLHPPLANNNNQDYRVRKMDHEVIDLTSSSSSLIVTKKRAYEVIDLT